MTQSPAAAAIDPMLCFAVYSADRRIGQVYRELLAPWSLSYTQYLVLVALWSEDDLTVGRLGSLLGLDSGTLSPLLKRLETRGLITRARSADDERVVAIGLTDAGAALRDELADVPRCLGERLSITREQADDLIRRLRVLVRP
ncbi:MarR family transcriptional regulator [Brooklawnia cerclae]|uniref:DNA-binding MarR family transcriptional regulator n=1 Tax=Brooklawnia cerclae TaxID=349934 RepID=A0ABX0SIY2_9ACTN|nr:MarR family transcriptional regulator [Brooklawnia cerclae]NIH57931.1 DNA-binding MarR family transcriptional regulator [Brooklawnia cerclae]